MCGVAAPSKPLAARACGPSSARRRSDEGTTGRQQGEQHHAELRPAGDHRCGGGITGEAGSGAQATDDEGKGLPDGRESLTGVGQFGERAEDFGLMLTPIGRG
jgi:hypothetical protein